MAILRAITPPRFKQRPLRFLGSVYLDVGMVVVVVVVESFMLLYMMLLLLLLLLLLHSPPATPSRFSPCWASSVHNALYADVFVWTPFVLLLSPPPEFVRSTRGRDSRSFLTARLHAAFPTARSAQLA